VDSTFAKKTVVFIDEDAKATSVMQGLIGDCWFMSSLSLTATDDQLLRGTGSMTGKMAKAATEAGSADLRKGIYPPLFHVYGKLGIYCLKFYKDGLPRWVVTDSRVPRPKFRSEVLFGSTRGYYETWVPLIEKAYAKLHHSYAGLVKGEISQGLADLTNGVPLKMTFKSKDFKAPQDKDTVWSLICQHLRAGQLVGCSADPNSMGRGDQPAEYITMEDGSMTGIFARHAYSITDAFEIPDPKAENYHKSHRLLRVNNPHGQGEWMLKWSEHEESGKLWQFEKDIRQHYAEARRLAMSEGREPLEEYVFKKGAVEDDGSFLMCFKDWRSIFGNLFLVLFPKPSHTIIQIEGEYSETSGGKTPE
jgi:calpain